MEHQMPEEMAARFEELAALEHEFEDVEEEIIRKAEALQSPLYKKRAEFVAKIPHFWSLVFEQAPPEIDNFIQPTDSKVFAECLSTFEVSRFELNEPNGSPRSFSLKFGFTENEYFEDKELEKKFWFRKTKDWQGLVSEPVKINWKKGKDLTGGLTDAAYKLGEMRTKLATDTANGAARKEEAKSAEYKKLAQKIETATDASVSFFGLFSFVSGYRWVSAQESAQAAKEEKERFEKIRRGEKVEEEEEEEEDQLDYQEIEVFPGGDEVATIIAEDMWPNAIKYYKGTFDEDEDDEELSDIDVDVMDASDDDDDEQPVDIRALVGKGRKAAQEPPAKKQRKA
ncbi:nap family protein [Stemphylium lycopersici]|nr:nap family protein [Stemphylium lycopersici]